MPSFGGIVAPDHGIEEGAALGRSMRLLLAHEDEKPPSAPSFHAVGFVAVTCP